MYKKNVNSTFIILTRRTVNCRLIEFIIGLHENADSGKNVGGVTPPKPPSRYASALYTYNIVSIEVKISVL